MKVKASVRVGFVLIFCYLVAWLDRMAINMTLPFISKDLQIGPEQEGWILSAFFLGYALFQIPGGLLADRFGPRRIILVALSWWSCFTALTGLVHSIGTMLVVRFVFGIGEGIFPASVWKVLGNWFTKKNRATANALVISSIALGPALTPLLVAPVIDRYDWRMAFWLLGICGIMCVLAVARFVYNSIQEAPAVSKDEVREYEDDLKSHVANTEKSLESSSFGQLAREPMVWVLFSIGLIANIALYGWLAWLPSYFIRVKHLNLRDTALAASLPFVFATVGCMSAGWISDRFFRGRRKVLVAVSFALGATSLWAFTTASDQLVYMFYQCLAGFLLFLACGACWALPMILLPTKLMGSGSGFINTGGQIGGFLANIIIGYTIKWRNNDYGAGFDVMVVALLLAALLVYFGIREKKESNVRLKAA